MPWTRRRHRRAALSSLHNNDPFRLQTDMIEPISSKVPYTGDVSAISPAAERAALFGSGMDPSLKGNDSLGFPNQSQLHPQRPYTQSWNGPLSGSGFPTLDPGNHAQLQPSPALNPTPSYRYNQSTSYSSTSFPQDSRLNQQNFHTLPFGHGEPHVAAPLYLENIAERDIKVTITRKDGIQVEAIARATCSVPNMFISRREAAQLGLKIHPIIQSKPRQYPTPIGLHFPVGYVGFHIESKSSDIHRTYVSVMVLEDLHNNLTSICLGVKFFEKVYGTKLAMKKRLPQIPPKETVGADSMASYTMAQVSDSNATNGIGWNNTATNNMLDHYHSEYSQDMGRSAAALGPQQLVGGITASPAPNTKLLSYPNTASHLIGYPHSEYLSPMPSLSEPSATTSINSFNPLAPQPFYNTELLGNTYYTTIDPRIFVANGGNGSSSSDASQYAAPHQTRIENEMSMLSGQGSLYYGHP